MNKSAIISFLVLATALVLAVAAPRPAGAKGAEGAGKGAARAEDGPGAAIREYVLQHSGPFIERGDEVIVSEVRTAYGAIPRGRAFSYEISARNRGRMEGRVSFNVRVLRGGRVVRTVITTARVRVLRTVVRALRRLGMGEVIGEGDVESARVEARDVPATAARGTGEVVGMAARRPITAGRVIRTDYLERPRMVRKGQRVLVLATVGPIMVRSRAIALSDGLLDGEVKARTTGGRVISGEVTGPGEITVELR